MITNSVGAIKLAIPLIKGFEAFRSKPYLDSVGVPTIGYGTILYPNGVSVTMKDTPITEVQASDYLMIDLNARLQKIASHILRDPTNHQLAAMLSLSYNIGIVGFISSTVLRKFNANDLDGASKAFLSWNKETKNGVKVVSTGLSNRRKKESDFFNMKD